MNKLGQAIAILMMIVGAVVLAVGFERLVELFTR